ncbi:MAG: hypothetical protein H0A76_05620 [Candidatus Thiodubiliella endoseptemdiera]|uniref:Uncharacterized protein n=1 Tax=Candidatus Thiodubiliella endoseptemdiera TaxID=2738886 RepID=A0A853F1H4_9GAMM|nr:hypothetical protein [Candidatus Thiodubiliella endoseptemdiera]
MGEFMHLNTIKYRTTSNPAYEAKTGDSNPFNSIDVEFFANLADIDGDGDLIWW